MAQRQTSARTNAPCIGADTLSHVHAGKPELEQRIEEVDAPSQILHDLFIDERFLDAVDVARRAEPVGSQRFHGAVLRHVAAYCFEKINLRVRESVHFALKKDRVLAEQ